MSTALDPLLRSDFAPSRTVSCEVSLFRLYTLRVAYLVLAVGLGMYIWPLVIHHSDELAATAGIRLSLLAGIGGTALLGLRYPLQMVPLLLFELIWKAIYLIAFALPISLTHQMTAAMAGDVGSCLLVVIFLPLIPWGFVFDNYFVKHGDRWK